MRNKSGEGLRGRTWKRFLRGPDPTLLEELYIPALGEALCYDRCCAYFSSTVLAAAARGFGRLIERLEAMGDAAPRPAVRLLVNEELAEEDILALTETGDETRLEEVLKKHFRNPTDALEKKRLGMLGWLVKNGLLDVRVGVMRRGEGIVHAKFGIVSDTAGDALVFSGSGNETGSGLLANYDRLEVSTSWEDPERHQEYRDEFEALWTDRHPDVHSVTLPEALRLKLIKFAPKEAPTVEPSNALARQKAAMVWQFIVEAPYLENGAGACDATAFVDLWPHQRRVVEETAAAWPDGRLLCDEVGMGKTIEAILVLRRLMAGRGVRRVLILVPAGLTRQWQGELREKGGLVVPRLEGTTNLLWPDDAIERIDGLAAALKRDLLIMSRETARTEGNLQLLLEAAPWDLVILDEGHAARRKKQEEGEFNSGTLLLNMMRQLQLRRQVRGIIILSATPMQTSPWEPWDLLSVLGEGGRWLASFEGVRRFYGAVAAMRAGGCDLESARQAAVMIADDPAFPAWSGGAVDMEDAEAIARALAFVPGSRREETAAWLRRGSPLARRMHRNTRATLRHYYERGILSEPPPERLVTDVSYGYEDTAERRVYDAVTRYIERRFAELEGEKPGKGFVMTIYRRRASSSPLALERSLLRRREGLARVARREAYDEALSAEDIPEYAEAEDYPEGEGVEKISSALPKDKEAARLEMDEVARVLEELQALGGRDSKRDAFFNLLRTITEDGRAVLVFTEYTDTLEYLRDLLVAHYGTGLGCYSGAGGQRYDGNTWQGVTKDAIKTALFSGELRVVLCTDAASEGLNLQAAGALINYDLPWNPSKVEQRIGRIDRIGQKLAQVRVVNLFLRDSVDERVYQLLRERCGLFEHFVGPMQPVLARARYMLMGREDLNLETLEMVARDVEREPLATETYVESTADAEAGEPAPLERSQVEEALAALTTDLGYTVKRRKGTRSYELSSPGKGKLRFGADLKDLEQDRSLRPLSPLAGEFGFAESLERAGERLPLVIGSYQNGPFRASIARWAVGAAGVQVTNFKQLRELVDGWDGTYPDPECWMATLDSAREQSHNLVETSHREALRREQSALGRQREAARIRLLQELGRYLLCLGVGTGDLNAVLYQQMTRDIAGAQRLKRCLEALGGYPTWDDESVRGLGQFVGKLTENQRRARLLGKELDAALEDPRWGARVS